MVFKEKYAKYYDLFNGEKDYSVECEFLEKIFKKNQINVNSILDLGCGTGLHSKELISRGYRLTGIDISPEMIEIAKKRNRDGEFIVGDISDFNLNKKFDVIICMFSVLGYLTSNKQIEKFFKNAKNHLNENGLLIVDCWSGLGVMREPPITREKIIERGNIKIIRKSFPKLDSKSHLNSVRFDVRIFENDGLIESYNENHNVRFFFPLELKKYIEDSGLVLLKICPSFEIDYELDEKYWNMTLISKKL